MAYWLFKSEPNTWSFEDQLAKGDEGEGWDGVRNHQAGNNMKSMKIDELGFFYHSVIEKRIVGIVRVSQKWHLDPTDPTGRFGMVSVVAVKRVGRPVTLTEIKNEPLLNNFALVRQSRLSVVPVSPDEWKILLNLSNTFL